MGVEETDATEAFVRAIYPELRDMAARLLRGERDDHTLQRTALAHEAFLRLTRLSPDYKPSAEAFLAMAARQMRHILVDHARKHRSGKRGGSLNRVPLFDEAAIAEWPEQDALLDLDEALNVLGALDSRALSVVELKFFGGFTNLEAARILQTSDSTVETDWQFARSWLYGRLKPKL
jgi:RNA polymerase sigma factor (TIGR02999 family)